MLVNEKLSIGELIENFKTPHGIYILDGVTATAGVLPYSVEKEGNVYSSGVFIDPYTLFDSSYSLIGTPVIVEHSDNINKEDIQGLVIDTYQYSEYQLGVRVAIWGDEALNYIRQGNYELSAGYTADVVNTQGNWYGSPYDYVKTNLVYDHLAIVKKGTARNGAIAKLLLDSTTMKSSTTMTLVSDSSTKTLQLESFADINANMKYINIPNHTTQFSVPEEVAEYLENLLNEKNQVRQNIEDSNKSAIVLTETKQTLENTTKQLQDAKTSIADLETELKETKSKLPKFLQIATKAEKLGVTVDYDKFDPVFVMREAVKDKYPNANSVSEETLNYLFSITEPKVETPETETVTKTETITDSKVSRPSSALQNTLSAVKPINTQNGATQQDLADSVFQQRKKKIKVTK